MPWTSLTGLVQVVVARKLADLPTLLIQLIESQRKTNAATNCKLQLLGKVNYENHSHL